MKQCPKCRKQVADGAIICPTWACTHVFMDTLAKGDVAPIHATYPAGAVRPTDI
jgi:hypothetical protein